MKSRIVNTGTVVFFGSARWNFLYQRTRALSEEFAGFGWRSFFIEPMPPLLRVAREKVVRLTIGKNAKLTGTVEKPGVQVLTPPPCLTSFRGSLVPVLDKFEFRVWFNRIRNTYGITTGFSVISMPFWWEGIVDRESLAGTKIVYDCIDDLSVFARNQRILGEIERRESSLLKNADTILYTSTGMRERLEEQRDASVLHHVPNGVGFELFNTRAESVSAYRQDLEAIRRPIAGYIGGLFEWFDVSLLSDVARRLPEVSFVLIGPQKNRELEILKGLRNVHLLGPRKYSAIPYYLDLFDACVIPFKVNKIIENTDPIKIYEYFALGKPVVATNFHEARRFGDLLYTASGADEFANSLLIGLAERDQRLKISRQAFARNNSWKVRAEKVKDTLLNL